MPPRFTPTFLRTQLGRKTWAWCIHYNRRKCLPDKVTACDDYNKEYCIPGCEAMVFCRNLLKHVFITLQKPLTPEVTVVYPVGIVNI